MSLKIKNQEEKKEVRFDRIIGKIEGNKSGPTIVFIGGIHGNEPSGVYALYNVINMLDKWNQDFCGKVYALCGNISALKKGQRFDKYDLNRIWTTQKVEKLNKAIHYESEDEHEQVELFNIIDRILHNDTGPFYFIDLHTTSAQTIPFITINDSLINRNFSLNFPVPLVLGIEEFLEGPLLSYMNEIGHTALGFEAGQHEDPISVVNHESFVWLTLVFAGCITKEQCDNFNKYFKQLKKAAAGLEEVFEIRYRHEVKPHDSFKMLPGFLNFQKIKIKQHLAVDKEGDISAKESGRIFMPLYQNQGNDGFFVIKKIAPFWLKLSAWLRKVKFETLLALLPGVKLMPEHKNELEVNLKIARFLAIDFFHLLGYRRKHIQGTKIIFVKQRYDVKPIN